MDLGASVCTPRNPGCLTCPWQNSCEGRARGMAESLPRRAPKRERPLRHGVSFWLMRADGAVLLRRRPDEGLLGGMIELPTTPWRDEPWDLAEASAHAPQPLPWQALPEPVRHGFTHFEIELLVAVAETEGVAAEGDDGAIWCPPARFLGARAPDAHAKARPLRGAPPAWPGKEVKCRARLRRWQSVVASPSTCLGESNGADERREQDHERATRPPPGGGL